MKKLFPIAFTIAALEHLIYHLDVNRYTERHRDHISMIVIYYNDPIPAPPRSYSCFRLYIEMNMVVYTISQQTLSKVI